MTMQSGTLTGDQIVAWLAFMAFVVTILFLIARWTRP